MLSNNFGYENKIKIERKNSNSHNSASEEIADINYLQKFNEDPNYQYDSNTEPINNLTQINISKDNISKSKFDLLIQQNSINNSKINIFEQINFSKNGEINHIKNVKHENTFNDDQIKTNSTLSTENKSNSNVFLEKIINQVQEFNKVNELSRFKTTCNRIDIEDSLEEKKKLTKENLRQIVNCYQINKKNEKEFKITDKKINTNLNFCYFEIQRKNFVSSGTYKKFCENASCGVGCFLKFLKLNSLIQEIIWNKFGLDNYLGEIKELYFKKLFSVYKFDPCSISFFLSSLNDKENIDYNVSCFSVKDLK